MLPSPTEIRYCQNQNRVQVGFAEDLLAAHSGNAADLATWLVEQRQKDACVETTLFSTGLKLHPSLQKNWQEKEIHLVSCQTEFEAESRLLYCTAYRMGSLPERSLVLPSRKSQEALLMLEPKLEVPGAGFRQQLPDWASNWNAETWYDLTETCLHHEMMFMHFEDDTAGISFVPEDDVFEKLLDPLIVSAPVKMASWYAAAVSLYLTALHGRDCPVSGCLEDIGPEIYNAEWFRLWAQRARSGSPVQ